jgi:transcriptional regulator with XRE-family HTH domain
MSSRLPSAIRGARAACGLTQEQLGRRLGLKGRAVYRWERGDISPRPRHLRALVTAINAVNQNAAAILAAVVVEHEAQRKNKGKGKTQQVAPPPAAPPPPPDPKLTLELAIFTLADELDLSPRRLRLGLSKLLQRLREHQITLPQAEQHLAAWSESQAS